MEMINNLVTILIRHYRQSIRRFKQMGHDGDILTAYNCLYSIAKRMANMSTLCRLVLDVIKKGM